MNVIAFQAQRSGEWRARELNQIVDALTPTLEQGHASGWDVGATEAGDPQFYLLGPAPDLPCEICISRVGRTYVLEDGHGRLLFDTENLSMLAERTALALRGGKAQVLARVMLVWFVAKQVFQEKIEPLLIESEEMLAEVAPQLAMLA